MYVQLFPIYGIMVGINYWTTTLDTDDDIDEDEHLIQIMFFIIGISFHFWKKRG